MATLNLVTQVLVKGEQNLKKLSSDLGKVDDQASKTTKRFGGIGSALGSIISPTAAVVGTTVALGAAAIGAAQAALEEERGIAALTASLKANDPVAAGHIDQIEKTIAEREKLAFSDDEQRESLAQLVAQTGDYNKALDLNRTAMDLARLRNIDLVTASTILGKVSGGNVGILSRYGIQLRKGATAAEALATIQKRAAGQAEEFANTTAGATESLGHAFSDLVEDIGKQLLPVLKDAAIFIRDDLIPFIRDLAPAVSAVGSAIGSVAGFITQFVNPFGAALDRQREELKTHQAEEAKRLKAGEDAWLGYQTTITNATDSVVDTVRGLTDSELATIEEHWDDIKTAGSETVHQYNLGIFEAQTSLNTEVDALLEALKERLTPAQEMARLQGQQMTLALARAAAVAAGDQPAVDAIDEMIDKINTQINSLSGFAGQVGTNIVTELVAGMKRQAALQQTKDDIYAVGNIIRDGVGIFSEPKDSNSPLRGITQWGGNIVKTITEGMRSELGMARSASTLLASSLAIGSVSSTQGLGGASDSAAGVTVNLTVQGDLRASERTLPGMIVRSLYASGLTPQ